MSWLTKSLLVCSGSEGPVGILMILNYFMGAEIITYRKINWLNTVKH